MNCLIIAATTFEIAPFLEQFRTLKKWPAASEADILITGIGLTATTYSLTKQLFIKRPDLVLQAGIGGCFNHSIPLGTVFAVKQEAIADQGVIESKLLKPLIHLNNRATGQSPFSKGWLINKSEGLKITRLKKVKGISTNEITTSRQKMKLYQNTFDPVVESMEGAALHYVCIREKIPFLQIRSVSNYITERNKKKWNLDRSIINLNKELLHLLSQL